MLLLYNITYNKHVIVDMCICRHLLIIAMEKQIFYAWKRGRDRKKKEEERKFDRKKKKDGKIKKWSKCLQRIFISSTFCYVFNFIGKWHISLPSPLTFHHFHSFLSFPLSLSLFSSLYLSYKAIYISSVNVIFDF